MRKKGWLITIILIVMILLVGGGLYFWWPSSEHSDGGQHVSTSKKVARQSVKATNSAASTTKNNLDVDKLGAQTTAVTILSYARQITDNSSANTWAAMYKELTANGIQVVLSKANVDKMSKPGTGIAYYILPKNSSTDTSKLQDYPSYTLENDKTIHFYGPNQFTEPIKTTTLKVAVQTANNDHEADTIRGLADHVKVVDASNQPTESTDSNQVTLKELNAGENHITTQAVIFYGMKHYDEWKKLQKYVDKDMVRFNISSGGGQTYTVGFAQAGDTGLFYNLQPANPDEDRPDVYFFGSGDDPKLGFADIDDICKYVNANGGRRALDTIKIDGNSEY